MKLKQMQVKDNFDLQIKYNYEGKYYEDSLEKLVDKRIQEAIDENADDMPEELDDLYTAFQYGSVYCDGYYRNTIDEVLQEIKERNEYDDMQYFDPTGMKWIGFRE